MNNFINSAGPEGYIFGKKSNFRIRYKMPNIIQRKNRSKQQRKNQWGGGALITKNERVFQENRLNKHCKAFSIILNLLKIDINFKNQMHRNSGLGGPYLQARGEAGFLGHRRESRQINTDQAQGLAHKRIIQKVKVFPREVQKNLTPEAV